jgi:hypothetical protein
VEGARNSQHLHSQTNGCVGSFVDVAKIRRRNVQYRHTLFLQPSVAAFVVPRPIAHAVTYSVYLDRKACFRAIEVEDVGTDRMLATKDWLIGTSRTQPIPQAGLWR